jgi:hypothetical protein
MSQNNDNMLKDPSVRRLFEGKNFVDLLLSITTVLALLFNLTFQLMQGEDSIFKQHF